MKKNSRHDDACSRSHFLLFLCYDRSKSGFNGDGYRNRGGEPNRKR